MRRRQPLKKSEMRTPREPPCFAACRSGRRKCEGHYSYFYDDLQRLLLRRDLVGTLSPPVRQLERGLGDDFFAADGARGIN